MLNRTVVLAIALAVLAWSPVSFGGDVVVTSPDHPAIYATALDQPELYCLLTDDGQVITDGGEPVIFEAFIDTGASGFVISHLLATGEGGIPSLGLDAADFIGQFTETGISGTETGDVTRGFGVSVSNITPGTVSSIDLTDFNDYGQFNLWTRRSAGLGELLDLGPIGAITDPLNVVGMPVISQRTMVMDPSTMDTLGRMTTYLLPAGDPAIPQTNITFDLQLADLTGPATPPEILPSHHDNPMVTNVTISHTDQTMTTRSDTGNTWLLDTGSGSTILSFADAQAVGLIGPQYATLEQSMAEYDGPTAVIGGIGPGSLTVPILQLDEIRIPAREGFDVVWPNVDVLVADVAGLDGVFGMNLLLPSATVDASALGLDGMGSFDDVLQELLDLLEEVFGGSVQSTSGVISLQGQSDELDLDALLSLLEMDISPGYFDHIVFDATDPTAVQLRLYSPLVPEPTTLVLLAAGCAVLLRRRR